MIRPMCVLLALCGCTPESVDIRTETNGCEDIDLTDPPEAALKMEIGKDEHIFFREPVFESADMAFDPELDQNRREITVREYWVGDGEGSDACFSPTVVLEAPPSGEWTLLWYIGDDLTPFDNEVFEVD